MRIDPTRSARLLAIGTFLAVTACSGDSITDPLSGARMARGGGKPVKAPHDPILFVHGWNASSSTWTTMVARFKKDGWTDAELASWSYNGNQSNAVTAETIRGKVDSILLATGAAKVDIITHSMGSLSARYFTRNLSGSEKVDALVTLGGPDHGTNIAYFCGTTACVEMRPNSSFLTALNLNDETWGSPRYATWRSPCDEVIQPQSSSILGGGALNTETACINHSALHEDATVYQQVRDWVKTAVAP